MINHQNTKPPEAKSARISNQFHNNSEEGQLNVNKLLLISIVFLSVRMSNSCVSDWCRTAISIELTM